MSRKKALKPGMVVDVFLDYKEQRNFVGKAVLLSKTKKSTLPALSFFSDEENKQMDVVNDHLLKIPLIEGESNGIDYKVKPIPLKYKMYTFEQWLVQFIDSTYYPVDFKKYMKIRVGIGEYSNLKEASLLTINSRSENEVEEIYNEED